MLWQLSPPDVPYHRATRHPLPCLLFLLPLLAAYEVGVAWIGSAGGETVRNGADAWLRWALEDFGLNPLYGAPVLVALVFVVWSVCRRADRPDDLVGVCLGMAIESVGFGLGLWGVSRALGPVFDALALNVSQEQAARVVTFVGAGIYEELLFRLVLFSGLVGLLRLLYTPNFIAVPMAAVVSAAAFAAAHHVGPYGEPFDECAFIFRAVAGLYFAALYQARGFGIAVGAHACYDVLVG